MGLNHDGHFLHGAWRERLDAKELSHCHFDSSRRAWEGKKDENMSFRAHTQEHHDSLGALLFLWRPEALQLMITATRNLVRSAFNRQTERHFWLAPPLPLPLPTLWPWDEDDDPATETWIAALDRFADAPVHIREAPEWTTWARALLLGMLAMTQCTRELFFADLSELVALRHARSPPIARRRTVMGHLGALLHDFAWARYSEPALFVARAASLYLFGTPALHAKVSDLFPRDEQEWYGRYAPWVLAAEAAARAAEEEAKRKKAAEEEAEARRRTTQ